LTRYPGAPTERMRARGRGRPLGWLTLIALLLALAIIFVGRARSDAIDNAVSGVMDWFAGVQSWMSVPVNEFNETVDGAGALLEVYEENKRLREENARLLAWQAAAQRLESKLARYEALLNLQVDPAIHYVSGRIVADSGSPFVRTKIVNVGAEHGVARGQAVVNGDGLLGHIVSVGKRASRVLLVTDLNSRVPVMIEPTGQRAILAGDNDGRPRLNFLVSHEGVAPGDRVVTSGDGGVLPRGLPVGTVRAVGEEFVTVDWVGSHGRIDYVRVLKFSMPRKLDDPDAPAEGDDPVQTPEGAPVEATGEIDPVAEEGEPASPVPPTPRPAPARNPERETGETGAQPGGEG